MDIYVTSLYYQMTTLTTVGYGDISAIIGFEKYYGIFVIIVGTCAYSWILTYISNYIKKNNEKFIDFEKRMGVLKEIKRVINIYQNKSNIINIINKYIKKNNVDKINYEINNTENKIINIQKKIDAIYLDKLEGIIPNDMYLRIYNELLLEKENYEKKHKLLLEKLDNQESTPYIDKVKKFMNSDNPNQLLISNLIDKIEIDEEKNIYIFYKFIKI